MKNVGAAATVTAKKEEGENKGGGRGWLQNAANAPFFLRPFTCMEEKRRRREGAPSSDHDRFVICGDVEREKERGFINLGESRRGVVVQH